MIWLPFSASAWNVRSGSFIMNEMVWAWLARFWKSSHCLHRRITGGLCIVGVCWVWVGIGVGVVGGVSCNMAGAAGAGAACGALDM